MGTKSLALVALRVTLVTEAASAGVASAHERVSAKAAPRSTVTEAGVMVHSLPLTLKVPLTVFEG